VLGGCGCAHWGVGLRQGDLAAQRRALVTCSTKRLMVSYTPGVLPCPSFTLGKVWPSLACSRDCWGAVGVLSGGLSWGRVIWQLRGEHLSLAVQRGWWSPALQLSSLVPHSALVRSDPLQPALGSVGVLLLCSVGRWAEAGWSCSSEESTCLLQYKEADGLLHFRCPPLSLIQPWLGLTLSSLL